MSQFQNLLEERTALVRQLKTDLDGERSERQFITHQLDKLKSDKYVTGDSYALERLVLVTFVWDSVYSENGLFLARK